MNKVLLMRDSLSDQGQIPSPGSYCSSPDLIVHDQVADPQNFFKANYNQDVNQSIDRGSGVNFIYARVKNLSTTDTLTAYVHLYASNASLFMTPSRWKNNRVCSAKGEPVIETMPIAPGEIGVVKEPFIFNAKSMGNYCHVGYVLKDAGTPDIPDSFASYSEFVVWMQGNTHICLRNFRTLGGRRTDFDQISEFSNPSSTEERVGTFNIQLVGRFPVGTQVQVKCAAIGLCESRQVTTVQNMTQFPVGCIVPPGISAYLTTSIFLPSEAGWPTGATLRVVFYVSESVEGVAFKHSVPMTLLGVPVNAPHLFRSEGRLIKVGECSTRVMD